MHWVAKDTVCFMDGDSGQVPGGQRAVALLSCT